MQIDIAGEVKQEIEKNLAAQDAAEIQNEIEQQRRTDFKSSMTVAANFEPTKFAQALKVQRESGVPAKVAYDNADQISTLKQEAKFAGLFATGPRTAQALSTPEHAILAQGDEENLLRMEKAAEAADFYKQGILERQILGPLKKWWNRDDITEAPGRLTQLDRITADFDRVDAGDQFSSPWANEYRNADAATRKQMRDNANLERNLTLDKVRVAQFKLNEMPVDPGDVALERAEGAAGVFGVIADDPMLAGRIAAQSLPDMAQGIVAGMINPLFGGVSEGVTASNYKFLEVLQEKGIDPADPVQLLQALRNDELLSDANERAIRYGAGIAAVSTASFGLLNRVLAPTKFNGKLLSKRAREGINVIAQVPAQGALEAGGELAGQIAERGQLSDVDAKEIALEGLVGGFMSTPEVGAFAGKRFVNHMTQARRAERAGKLQADLVQKSLQSTTRQNDPASFEAIVSTQLAGRPNEFLEIPAAKLQELNQSGQVNIAELLENVGIDPEHYTAQVELGGTITIKNSAYLAYLAEQDEFLRGSIRVTSNDYSLDDVQELDRQMLADMEKIAAQFGQTDQVATAYSDVMGQLLNAGYERGAADTTARQYAAVMTRLAEQTGQSVEDVMAANPLNIGREVPQQVQRIREDQLSLMLGRLRAGDIPQAGDMFGKTLTEYLTSAGGIQDIGGELAAFDADTGKRGRNRLTRTDGMTPDDAAMRAWERGYFPGVPREEVTPNLLIDALREESAGTPRYSVEQENATLRDQAASLEALQEFLDREGVDLATATDEDIRALLTGQSTDQTLNQFAGERALTANMAALADAKARLAAGADPEEVRKATGWFKGADGKMRFEITDGDAKLTTAFEQIRHSQFAGDAITSVSYRDGAGIWSVSVVTDGMNTASDIINLTTTDIDSLAPMLGFDVIEQMKQGQGDEDITSDFPDSKYITPQGAELRSPTGKWSTLGEILDHPRLFEAYPQLADLKVVYAPEMTGGAHGAMAINARTGESIMVIGDGDAREVRKTVLHETQHAIQSIEDFAKGGSVARLRDEPAHRAAITRENEQFQLQQWAKKYPEAAQLREKISALHDQLEQQYGDPFSDEAVASDTFGQWQDAIEQSLETEGYDAAPQTNLDEIAPLAFYERLAGEIEARAVENRSHMTDRIAQLIPPSKSMDIKDADAIVYWNGEELPSPALDMAARAQTMNQSAVASPDLQRALAMSEDEYVATVNPSGETNTEDGSARLVRGDLTDPQSATVLVTLDNGTTIERDEDGSFYAREGGDTIGEIINYGDEVNVNVLPEARGQGVAVALAAEFIRENPFFDAGSLTPGGEAVVRAAWRKLKAEQDASKTFADDIAELATFYAQNENYQFERFQERENIFDRFVARAMADDKFQGMQQPTSYGSVMITPSAKEAGMWQVTQFAQDGAPSSDNGIQTKEQALRDFIEEVRPVEQSQTLNQSAINVTPEQETEYAAAVAGNKRRATIKMIEQAAGVEEVDASFDRGGAHDAPGPGAGSPIYDVTRDGTYPEDFYGPNGLNWYGAGDATDGPAYAIIKSLEARPNAPVKIYRAVPKDGAKKIIGGDWVTTVRQYAKDHGDGALGGDYKIISMTVSARDLFTSGDSFAEYGYHPQPFKPEFPRSESARSRSLSDTAANFAAAHPDSVGEQTLNQSAQTETEAFKRWFGDSKVVDADGKPLVVYHGTARDFTEFDRKKIGSNYRADKRGFFFTANPMEAEWAASDAAEKRGAEGERIVPVYLRLNAPLTIDATGAVGMSASGYLDTHKEKILARAKAEKADGIVVRGGKANDIIYVAFRPEQIKSAIGNRGTFDPNSPNILQQSTEDTPRGSITFGPRKDGVRRFDIKLTAKSDLSTVLHEMGHYYLEVIGDLVQDGKANEALTGDYAVIREWLGAEAGKPLTVDQHEQFARGFEKYLAEGKAPSIELQTAFARFKRWLVGIYKDLKRLNVELSPEVRGVFDRLLASQEAISEAEQALALSQQFESGITKIMTPEELANYQRASQQARDDATDEIEQEILKAERRKETEWYKEQRKAVEAEVRAELEALPAYQARKYLFGNTPHPQTGKPVKLDTAAVTELFGTRSKQARFLGRARVKTGGMHPETAAFLLGYADPVEMLTDMMAVEGLSAAIKAETDKRMAERYPDPRVSGELAEKAMAAVGEREAEVQAIQLRALAREAGRKATQHRIIKEAARQHIARLRLRDAIPYQYQRASAKAARAVEEALMAGNLQKAYEEKERQLMNLHLYREAVKAQELADQKRAQAKAYMKAGAKRKRLQEASVENYELAYPDGRIEYAATKTAAKLAEEEGATVTPLFNFLEQVDQLLQKYEFGIPRKAIRQQREALQQFLASMANESIVVNPPEWLLLDRAERTNWKDLTIDQLVDVVDMIRQIDQMAKNKLFVLKGDKWAEYEPIRDAIAASIELNGHKAASGAFNRNFKDQIRKWGREWLGFLPADQIARELDGQDDLGPVQENITTPVQKAARDAVIREKLEMNGLAELVRQFYDGDQIKGMHDAGKLVAIPEIGQSMTRMQMVMLMANLGNEGNRNALLTEQRGIWTAETIQAVMAQLDSNDADFVEALWAWIDKFWPEIAEAEAKRTGVAPAKVQGSPYPVKLADGKVRVLKGGYFPLKYDGEASIKTSQDDVGNAFKNMTAGRTAKAYTPDGHRIERVGSGGRPVKLDFSVVTGHVGNIVRDLTMTDPINQAWRFLHDTTVQGAFERGNVKELHTALEIWMQDSAEGEKVDSGYMTASARWLRTGFTANVMLFNLANSLLNLAGTHPLVVLGKRWAMHGYRAAFMPANWEQMYELSPFMREARVESYSKDLALVQDQMASKGGWRQAMTAAGFYLHNKTQQFMDAVVWRGAYEKGMSLDLVGQALIDYADQRVVEASGSGVFADRSALERGTLSRQTRQNEIVRGLTTLAGYMIRKMAIARRRTGETDFKDIGQAMHWAVDMALLFTLEGLAFAFVKGNVPDDDEDEQAKEWAKTAAWETFASVGSGLPPFGRPIVSSIQGFGGGSTSVDIFSEQFGNALQQVKQGDPDTTALKALVALTGTATKTPGIATNRVIDWLDRAKDGETPPWWELFTGNRNK